jgi:FkbM family methyltransferase
MKQEHGIWLPDEDQHFAGMMAKVPPKDYGGQRVGVYQHDKLQAALDLTKGRTMAVDVGAHVGFWSMWLAQEFERVIAFEPCLEHAECFTRNVTAENVKLHRVALGAASCLTGIARDPENSGKAHVSRKGDPASMLTLDEFEIERLDLLKIDVEGFESAVLMGACQTLVRCRPVVVVEDNGQGKRYDLASPVKMLEALGAKVLKNMRSDFILGWK